MITYEGMSIISVFRIMVQQILNTVLETIKRQFDDKTFRSWQYRNPPHVRFRSHVRKMHWNGLCLHGGCGYQSRRCSFSHLRFPWVNECLHWYSIFCATLTLPQFLLTFCAVMVPFQELYVVVCIFDKFIKRWVYFDGKNYRNFELSV